jgi:signal transduction histidine kinase
VGATVRDRLSEFLTRILADDTTPAALLALVEAAQRAFDPAVTGLPVDETQRLGAIALAEVSGPDLNPYTPYTLWFQHPYFAIAVQESQLATADHAAVLTMLQQELPALDGMHLWRVMDPDAPLIDIAGAGATVPRAARPDLVRALHLEHPHVVDDRLLYLLRDGDAPFVLVEVSLPSQDTQAMLLHILTVCRKAQHALERLARQAQLAYPSTWQRVLTALTKVLTVTHSADDVLSAMGDQVRQALPCERITYWEYLPEDGLFTLRALSARLTGDSVPAGTTCAAEDTPLLVAWHTGQPLLLGPDWPERFPNYPNANASIQGLAVVPVVFEYRRLGVITVERLEPRLFERRDVDWLLLVAGMVASALSNLSIHAALQDAQDRMVQNAKMRALGEMAAGIAHDFNNILMGLMCNVELLRFSTDLPQALERLPRLERAIMDARTIVQRVNTFGRTDPAVTFTRLSLREVAEETLEMMHAQLANADILITTDYGSAAAVMGSATELREVITNLLTNAAQAMPNGGALTLACGTLPGRAWVSVSDTGMGMSPAVLARACDPFFSTKEGTGTGLGLSVSYRIIQHHHGELLLSSTEGVGTTARIELPAIAETPDGDPPHDHPDQLHILLVEDNPDVVELLHQLLGFLGHRVQAATSVNEGIALLTAHRFDLVVTDLAMQGETGDAVAVAAQRQTPAPPVLLLSGSLQLEESNLRLYAGVLSKPVNLDTLKAAISRVMYTTA